MKDSILLSAGLQLSPLAMGCEALGGTDWGHVNIATLHSAVRCAWEMGITVYDTADVYGLGRSEEELSKALGSDRHDAIIITKVGVRWEKPQPGVRAKVYKDSSPSHLTNALEASLKRLRIEAIPLYLVHWPDVMTPLEQTITELERCRQEGKVLTYGLSNFGWHDFASILEHFPIAALEGKYNMIAQSPDYIDFQKACNAGLSTLAYGPLAQGLLTGKYDQHHRFLQSDRRHRLPQFSDESWPKNKPLLKILQQAADAHGKEPAQVALRWVIEQDVISSIIVGLKSPSQVIDNMGALGWKLDKSWLSALNKAAINHQV